MEKNYSHIEGLSYQTEYSEKDLLSQNQRDYLEELSVSKDEYLKMSIEDRNNHLSHIENRIEELIESASLKKCDIRSSLDYFLVERLIDKEYTDLNSKLTKELPSEDFLYISDFAEEKGLSLSVKNDCVVGRDKLNRTVLNINTKTNEGEVLIGEYRKGTLSPNLTDIDREEFRLNQYEISDIYYVRGNYANKIGETISVERKDGSIIKVPIVEKEEFMHGMKVRYNVPDFSAFSIADVNISADIAKLEALDHKKAAILQLAEDYKLGRLNSLEDYSPNLCRKLTEIAETQNSPPHLKEFGLEIHHDGNKKMQFIPDDIHCRKLPHLSGSWLMNESRYFTDLKNR